MIGSFVVTSICALVLTAGAAEDAQPTTKTFTYRKTPQGPLEMVVHFPPDWKASDRHPAIVFFFGGGWTGGTIKQFERQAEHLASRGMVAARADYRVKSRQKVTPDKCVEDAKSAVRWIREHAGELGVDPNKIVASGGSAGGHIAACTSLCEGLEADGEDTSISSKPNAMILFNPVLSFEGIPQLTSRLNNDEELAKQISPTRHLTKDSPPTLIFFGTADQLYAQGKDFMAKSKELGHHAEIFTADDKPHGFFNRSPWMERTLDRADAFLVSLGYLKPAATASNAP